MENKENVNLVTLLKCLIECSENASYIAQTCRRDEELFALLIQEKNETEKNFRFVQDFKTLADVLVQETIRWKVGQKFPSLCSHIFGEENNRFENTLGESIEVTIHDSSDKTVNLLSAVLDGRRDSAKALSAGIYKNFDVTVDVSEAALNMYLPASDIGIWIDPIDSTGEYVHGKNEDTCDTISSNGLKCVCVLIGVYMFNTGLPIMGVVNQPFFAYNSSSDRWNSKYFWAMHHESISESSILMDTMLPSENKIVISSCEDQELLHIIKTNYNVEHVAGAGYKSLLVACGHVVLYVLSCPTSYFWDTCGPHALLSALGGGIVNFKDAIAAKNLTINDLPSLQLKYTTSKVHGCDKMFCNAGGIIAYRDAEFLIEFLNHLNKNGYALK